jgi:hypothetical protein
MGIKKMMPGPLAPMILPSLKMTALSYSLTTLMAEARMINKIMTRIIRPRMVPTPICRVKTIPKAYSL